jgi:predicted amidohydrolase YtcJ
MGGLRDTLSRLPALLRTSTALLCAAALVLACQAPAPEPADLVLERATLLTPTGLVHDGSWVAVRSGRLALGAGTPPPARKTVDLSGRVLSPAFVDHHVHLLNVGLSLLRADSAHPLGGDALYLDLSAFASPAAIGEAVAARAAALAPGEWILGKGWSQGAWGAVELPDRAALDAAAPLHPVFLTRVDGHAGWANGAALDLAGIGAETPDPPGGRILRRADGNPTGVLLERANEPVLALLPRPSDAAIVEAFRRACRAMAALGVTDVYDAGFLTPPGIVGLNDDLGRYLRLLAAADSAAPLATRVRLMVPAPSQLAEEILADPASHRELSPQVEITHLKLFADGALGSRGGALTEPYEDDPGTSGVPRMTSEEILDWSRRAIGAGLDVATHALGDAAIAATLDAYEALLADRPELDPARLRIEHFSVALTEDFARAARLGIVLSIQPDFVYADDEGRTMEAARLGERSARAYAWGRLYRAGARLAAGSDYFTLTGAPMLGFYTAAYRTNEHGLPEGGWHPDERLPVRAAWELFTTLHRPGGGPPQVRRLATGEPADLVVLSGNPLGAKPAELPQMAVLATLRDGVVTFDDGSLGL